MSRNQWQADRLRRLVLNQTETLKSVQISVPVPALKKDVLFGSIMFWNCICDLSNMLFKNSEDDRSLLLFAAGKSCQTVAMENEGTRIRITMVKRDGMFLRRVWEK